MFNFLKYIILAAFLLLAYFSLGQKIAVYEKYNDFEHLLKFKNDTTYVVNFWATWCKPCVEELPAFEQIHQKFEGKKFKMILVSLDFEPQLKSKVIPFLNKNNITAEVVMLTDSKTNVWIDQVNEKWTGSIPVTIIYNSDFYYFREDSFTFDELNEIITKNIKK
jgi:thiol-disulfide isomerase/thioredoxin